MSSDIYVGLAPGFVLGHPFSPDDYRLAGALQASLSGTAFVGYRLARSAAFVEGGVRVIGSETLMAFEAEGYRGATEQEDLETSSLLLDLKLRLSL